jgi:hypothetical protein
VLPELELWLDDPEDRAADEVEPALLWPWNDRAAATETAPVTTTAPATNQRLIR